MSITHMLFIKDDPFKDSSQSSSSSETTRTAATTIATTMSEESQTRRQIVPTAILRLMKTSVLQPILVVGTVFLLIVGLCFGSFFLLALLFWRQVTDHEFLFTMNAHFLTIMLAFGFLLSLVSSFGCFAGCSRWKNGLMVYCAGVNACLILEVTICVLTAYNNISGKLITEGFNDTLKDYQEGGSNPQSSFADHFFHHFECCAVTDYEVDLVNIGFRNLKLRRKAQIPDWYTLPYPCCKDYDWTKHTVGIRPLKPCLDNPTVDNAYLQGCTRPMVVLVRQITTSLFIVFSVLSVPQMVLAVCSIILYNVCIW